MEKDDVELQKRRKKFMKGHRVHAEPMDVYHSHMWATIRKTPGEPTTLRLHVATCFRQDDDGHPQTACTVLEKPLTKEIEKWLDKAMADNKKTLETAGMTIAAEARKKALDRGEIKEALQ